MSSLFLFLIMSGIRPYEPVLIQGDQLASFLGQPVAQLFCGVYDGESWSVIPFQIDERDASDSFFSPDDGVFDANDEWVLDPQDGGLLAMVSHFGTFPGVDQFPRIQVSVTDPLSGDVVYFYLFQSTTPYSHPMMRMQYDSMQDEISCEHYILGFDNSSRQWDSLLVREDATWTWSLDLLDREKMRVAGSILGIPYTLNEDSFVFDGLSMVVGPLRVLREIRGHMTVFGQSFDANSEHHYYPGLLTTPSGSIANDPAMGITQVRVSIDWSPNMSGALLDSTKFQNVFIDGLSDGLGTVSFSQSELNALWYGFSKNDWHIIQIGRFQNIADVNNLYFRDDYTGGTSDGTPDTGDGSSYGDTGLVFQQLGTDEASLATRLFIDSASLLTGDLVQSYFLNPLEIQMTAQLSGDGFGSLLELWRHQNPESTHEVITVLDLIESAVL
jgi:hypothetical protein